MCGKTIPKMLHQHLQNSPRAHKMSLTNGHIHLDKTQKLKTKCSVTTRGLWIYERKDQQKLAP